MDNQDIIHIADISINARFEVVPSQYLKIIGLYIGKVKVCSYCIDGMSTKTDENKYVVNSTLPTMKQQIGRFKTEEECRETCLKVAQVFCKQLQG